MFKVLKTENSARRGEFHTNRGVVQTPAFMNVATSAAIKGAVSAEDLKNVRCQVMLSNTYHLHVRPGDKLIKECGGIHKFTTWDGPILTDSGGFQVFSLASLRKIEEEGVTFNSHIDGKCIFMGPEESMRIQSNLGSTIAMTFDECIANPAELNYARNSCARTTRWLKICIDEVKKNNQMEDAVNPNQLLFGINQGSTFDKLRIDHMKSIAEFQDDLAGYAIGGLAVGESAEEMYHTIETVEPYMPEDKPRYLMGVGTPGNILNAVRRGVDFFDCVMPSRNARHGNLFTSKGFMNLNNEKYAKDPRPIEEGCQCPACRSYSRSYIRHLFKARELLGMRLCVLHNLYFYNVLMERIREALDEGRFEQFYNENIEILESRLQD